MCLCSLKKESDPELDPDPDQLVRGTYGSGDPEQDPCQNVTDSQHCNYVFITSISPPPPPSSQPSVEPPLPSPEPFFCSPHYLYFHVILFMSFLPFSWSTWSVLKSCWIWAPRSRFTMSQVSFFRRFMNSTFAPGLNLDPPKVHVPDRGCETKFLTFFSILFLKVVKVLPENTRYVPGLAIKKSCPKKQKTTSKKPLRNVFLLFFEK